MIKQLKKITVQMLMGANVTTIVLMLFAGYSDRLHPADHPLLSTAGMTFPAFVIINLAFLLVFLLFKWTKAWIPALGLILAYFPIRTYLPIHKPATADVLEGDSILKVVSYNVCAYGGNYKYEQGFEVVRDYLRDENPDIVCLQEDSDTWRKYVFRDYAKNFAFNDTIVLCNTPLAFNCLGIHTRFPIVRRERIEYETTSNNGSAAWWLKVGKDTVIVINNHFESCHLTNDDRGKYQQILKGEMNSDSARTESKMLLVKLAEASAKRSKQIDAVCAFIQAHNDHPILLCGDFNDNPISYSRHAVSQLLTDCYVASGRGIGLSYNQKGFLFRIDHIFCSEHFEPVDCKIDDKMDASDHYPVICWLKTDIKP